MKREIKNYKIKKIHPRFFWHKCFICSNEFKNEDMWRVRRWNPVGHIDYHVCTQCAKTRETIEAYTKAGKGYPILVPIKSPGKSPNQYSHNDYGSVDNSKLEILENNSKHRKKDKVMNIGGIELTTKEKANKKWKQSCISYVNTEIENAIRVHYTSIDLSKKKLFPKLIEELKSNFDILDDIEDVLIISWK